MGKTNAPSRARAVREKCIDCCCGNQAEVRRCPATKCPLHPWRMGTLSKGEAANEKEDIEEK